MEQRQTFTTFIQPFLKNLHITSSEYADTNVTQLPLMPLFEVVEAIHHAYYFKKVIVLEFEYYTSFGTVERKTVSGRIQTPIQDSNHFAFKENDTHMTHLLSLEQVVKALV